MKNCLFLLGLLFFCHAAAQRQGKDYSAILKSKSIYEINAFLRDAHPDDPRRAVLKPRVMKLMKEYIRTAHPADQKVKNMQEMLALLQKRPSTKIDFDEMNALIKQKQIAKYKEQLEREAREGKNVWANTSYTYQQPASGMSASNSSSERTEIDREEEEFRLLMNISPEEHKRKTVQLLNTLFDQDPTSREQSVLIENKSDCNIIVRMEGVGNTRYRLAVPAKQENSIVVDKGNYLFSSLVCGAQYASQKTIEKAIVVSLDSPK